MTVVDRVRVGDVLKLERRAADVVSTAVYEEIGIRSFGKGIFHKEPISGLDLGAKRVFYIHAGDLVISNVFAWEGAIAVASVAEAGKIGSHRFMTFVAKDGRIDTGWAAWFFRSESGLELIRLASPGSAGRNRTLAIERFENLVIPVPLIDEQRRVAAALDRVSTDVRSLASLASRSNVLSRGARAALVAAPTPRDAMWESVRLADVLTPSGEQVSVEPEREYRATGIYSFGEGLIDRGCVRGFETSYKSLTLLRQDDIVFSKLNGWEGAVALVDASFDGSFVSGEYPVFRPNRDRLIPEFFAGISRSPWFWEALNANTRGSMVRRRRISESDFLGTAVGLPPVEEQARIAVQLALINSVEIHRRVAVDLANAIVPAALNEEFGDIG